MKLKFLTVKTSLQFYISNHNVIVSGSH